jgi:hypothetical protein
MGVHYLEIYVDHKKIRWWHCTCAIDFQKNITDSIITSLERANLRDRLSAFGILPPLLLLSRFISHYMHEGVQLYAPHTGAQPRSLRSISYLPVEFQKKKRPLLSNNFQKLVESEKRDRCRCPSFMHLPDGMVSIDHVHE